MACYKSYNKNRTKKICFKCKEMLDLNLFRIKEKKVGLGKGLYVNNICRSCEQDSVENYRLTDIGIAAEIVRRTKYKCKTRCLSFDLDKEWVLERLNSIEWKCELTKMPMKPNSFEKSSGFNWDSISADRVNPDGGYTKTMFGLF